MGGDRTCPDDCPLAVWAELSPADRKAQRQAVAVKLRGQGFTVEAIATQLGVSKSQISNDLATFPQNGNVKGQGKDTRGRKRSTGRPRNNTKNAAKTDSTKNKQTKPRPATPQQDKVRAAIADKLHDGDSINRKEMSKEFGVGEHTVQLTAAEETGALKERRKWEAEFNFTRGDLSPTAQHKFDIAVQLHQRKLDAQFEQRVLAEVKRRIDEIVLPHWKKQIGEAKKLYDRRKGVMDKPTYNLIRSCLHSDSRLSTSVQKLERAFIAFETYEKQLLTEKDSPTSFGDIPDSLAEWDKMRVKKRPKPATGSTVTKH
jgi:transposase